jgi:hypothetical protein
MVDWVAKLGNSKGLPTLLTGRAMRKRAILSASAAPLAPFSKAVALVIGRSRGRQGISTFHFTLAFVCVFFCVTGARAQMLAPQGRPVTAEDIVGKKVCWDNGRWGLYAANGEFSNDRHGGQHKWSVPEPGVIKTGNYYRQAEILPDGQFHSHAFKGRSSRDTNIDHWGKVCG